MKKLISLLLMLIIVLVSVHIGAIASGNSSFYDMSGAEAYAQAVERLSKTGIVNGYADGSFGPEKYVTRAEMAAMVCRFMGRESTAREYMGYSTDMATDVPYDHWASGYVVLAVDCGIINGDGRGNFRPNDNVTFEEAVKMIVCAAGLDGFSEHNQYDWAAEYLETAELFGMTDSVTCGRGEYANRGNIALMMYQALGSNQNAPRASHESGMYSSPQYVDMWTDSDADIYYALEKEGEPLRWTQYTGEPVVIDKTVNLFVVARKNGINVSDTREYYYKFEEGFDGLYDLSFDCNPRHVDINGSAGMCPSGHNVALQAVERPGYKFEKWVSSDGGTFSDEYDIMTHFIMPKNDVVISVVYSEVEDEKPSEDRDQSYADEDKEVFEEWDKYDHYDENGNFITYKLTVTMSGCGGIRNTSGKYAPGSNVPLYIYPGTEENFIRWTTTAGTLINPGNPTAILTMPDEDVTVCAEFVPVGGSVNRPEDNEEDSYDEDEEEESYEEDEDDKISEFEDKVIELVNKEREANGLSALRKDSDLAAVARAHSMDMNRRNFFDHKNPDGKSPFDRMKEYGIKYKFAAENIAWGQRTPEAVMKSWMNSEGHRANILSPDMKYIGVGIYMNGSVVYWTQCFKG